MAVSLRLLAEEHLDDIAGLLDDRDVLRFTRLPVPPPPGYAREWLDRYEAGRADGTREAFAAVDDDGRFLGLALAVGIDREGRQVELGYIVAPGARGRVRTLACRSSTSRRVVSVSARGQSPVSRPVRGRSRRPSKDRPLGPSSR